ncbi:MAG: hypothetical protein J3R72DRAFT_444981 [Linnemannia gamsii]|nr:MAG: hypothetical protein J3R72DRAFT_444981 [Linnemannia gamsii]
MHYSIASAIAAAIATGTVTAGVTTARGTKGREGRQPKFVHRPLKHTFFTDTSGTTTHASATNETTTTADSATTIAGVSSPVTTPTTTVTITTTTATDATATIATTTPASTSITTTTPTPTTSSETTEMIYFEPTESPLEKIPVDILLYIALLLPSCHDFAYLLQTCHYIYDSLDTHWVWHQRFLLRHGRGLLKALLNPRDVYTNQLLGGKTEEDEETSGCSKEDLNKWYCKFTRKSVPPKDMVIGHLDTGYWQLLNDPRSSFDDGLVANLTQGLTWLNVSAKLFGVPPGRYWVQWCFSLQSSSAVVGTQFRVATFSRDEVKRYIGQGCYVVFFLFCLFVLSGRYSIIDHMSPLSQLQVPLWHNENKNSIDYTPGTFRKFLHHTTATDKEFLDPNEAFIFQLPRVLVVEENEPTVFVQLREHTAHKNKDGIMVLFARVVPAGDDEDDVKAEREDVEGEDGDAAIGDELSNHFNIQWDNDNGDDAEGVEYDGEGEGGVYFDSDDDDGNAEDGEPVAADGGGHANGLSSSSSSNGNLDEDYNALPYFIRLAEHNSH